MTGTDTLTQIIAHCNRCMQMTNHNVLAHHTKTNYIHLYGGGELSPGSANQYLIVECAGCGDVHFVERDFEFDMDGEAIHGDSEHETINEYPPRVARPIPPWLRREPLYIGDVHVGYYGGQIDSVLRSILEESYAALQNGSSMLATMGARAALERLMLLKICDKGRFKANVDEFIQQGYLQPRVKKSLMEALEAGHAAIHRGYAPADSVLSDLYDVLEGIISATLVLPEKAANLQKVTPIRPVKPKSEKPKE